MTTHLSRPVAVVTGGTSGIGLAVVHDLAKDHQVYALGRNKDSLVALRLLQNVEAVEIDLLDFEAQQKLIHSLPQINVLVHAAAVSEQTTVENATPDVWQKQFSINLFAPAELTRLALPALREQNGQVVFINSGSGTLALPGHTVYSASKFALNALAHALRGEESENGVRVATVSPGPTDTPMNRKSRERAGNFAEIDPLEYSTPESVAHAVRLVVSASEDTQITDVNVRPRHDKAKR
ncbi:SDR family oxidoreductase [Rouxiella badensis]|uniref:SDR family oxidoreductase n=1 Tax=Rouxiella badensis TaxID=1646377 RepID=UPI001B474C0D|nr:SDR family oxidoreductase [Rouxiella badensis]MCC3703482.1 SDR family oxidoreductase [Rouxiella badensis]MCC3718420.1 SDR family oxidoreductase [Rouxiella badensis]MCC3726812.1 SDR family oxidoreductase [Rouxiella badensis]MCC3731905.1 SDR family oxidoreductase [Rouxiella badensis]MCC3738839.1 SDR family oxidoreductase [Rouxiella badensis]